MRSTRDPTQFCPSPAKVISGVTSDPGALQSHSGFRVFEFSENCRQNHGHWTQQNLPVSDYGEICERPVMTRARNHGKRSGPCLIGRASSCGKAL